MKSFHRLTISSFSSNITRYSHSQSNLTLPILYGHEFSQPTRSILMLCEENNISHNFTSINVFKGENRSLEFKKLKSFNGLIPVWSENDMNLVESAAILQYLCETRDLKAWLPINSNERYQILSLMHWHHVHTRLSTVDILRHKIFPNFVHEERLKRGLKTYTRSLSILEDMLTCHKYLTNDHHPSIADLLIVPEIDQLMVLDLYDYSKYVKILRWLDDMRLSVGSYEKIFKPVVSAAERFKENKTLF